MLDVRDGIYHATALSLTAAHLSKRVPLAKNDSQESHQRGNYHYEQAATPSRQHYNTTPKGPTEKTDQ
jgi:hypothetical protein